MREFPAPTVTAPSCVRKFAKESGVSGVFSPESVLSDTDVGLLFSSFFIK
jgi:hypothetical protein